MPGRARVIGKCPGEDGIQIILGGIRAACFPVIDAERVLCMFAAESKRRKGMQACTCACAPHKRGSWRPTVPGGGAVGASVDWTTANEQLASSKAIMCVCAWGSSRGFQSVAVQSLLLFACTHGHRETRTPMRVHMAASVAVQSHLFLFIYCVRTVGTGTRMEKHVHAYIHTRARRGRD